MMSLTADRLRIAKVGFFTCLLMITCSVSSATLMINVEVKNEQHTVDKIWVLEQDYPPFEHGLDQGKYIVVTITDRDGNAVLTERIPDPTIMRGVLELGVPNSTHGQYVAEVASYTLRYPYQTSMHRVKVTTLDTTKAPVTRSRVRGAPQEKTVVDEEIIFK
ncbi:hypothetical protein [Veronia pacifica]|uniref:Uncharacterized protein n=1 Tax=Veronia pacifica TaxID=1080227 RepID=A0A1C3ESD2_9GAMM|nr:hypothetical protein [Veronia pacifica]ODA36197.1 hypothetical protein A8L45_00915 [Veronia pacifica]